ncbi:hypothetical protein EC991753_5256, partial [Escherichia coli 99.1753]
MSASESRSARFGGARNALNVVGNALAVLVIAKWEHKFDR